MRAQDLREPYPTVRLDTPVAEAARVLAQQDLPGLVVVDDAGRPTAVLAGTDVLRMAVPRYCLDDPALARVVDEATADVFVAEMGDATVARAMPDRPHELPVVPEDATALEIAALMVRSRTPLVAVVDGTGAMLGAITLDALVERVLQP